jgi:hypothetical protein
MIITLIIVGLILILRPESFINLLGMLFWAILEIMFWFTIIDKFNKKK